jgi:hypothetical protein
VAATILYVGCSNPKAANDKNFAKAISAYLLLEKGSGKFCMGEVKYPHQESLPGQWTDADLAHVGLLEVTGRSKVNFMTTTDVFDLTPKGREVFTPGKGFCYGKPELIRIVNFTEPSSGGPYVMSRVTYLFRLKDVPSWVSESNGQIVEAFRERIPTPNHQFQGTQTFVLTSNGWVHQSLAR